MRIVPADGDTGSNLLSTMRTALESLLRAPVDERSEAGAALAVLASIFVHHPGWLNAIATGLGAGAILLLLAVLGALVMRTEAMGLGDVKLAVFVGLIVGFPGTFNALLYGILLAGFISILLIAVRVKGLKDTIAYGPYLCAGALIQLFVQG